ncbi:unnamed protein product, partial [Ectocarpus sp. 4 AP-2014]
GGRAAAASASAQHALQYLGSPLPLSPATRAGVVPPGSVLSSFASPGSASLRSSARSWQMFEEDMEADEDGATAAAAAGRSRASPRKNYRLLSDSRRGRGSILSQTVPVQRRGGAASKGGVALGGASSHHAGGIAASGGGGGGGG